MEKTLRLFDRDSALSSCSAVVTACEADNGFWRIVLDQTAFFPEGGGQDGDRGTINGIAVTDTHEKEGVIYHYAASPIPVGTAVEAVINRVFRQDRTEQHSGEHILSGIICHRFHCSNVGFHIGDDVTTVDFDYPMTAEDIRRAERDANELVRRNVALHIWYPSPEELEKLTYRSKKALPWPVRIVEIPGGDICACCGTHVKQTGEIGMIKVISSMNYKGGVRLTLLSGRRALDDYDRRIVQDEQISVTLSAPQDKLAEAVRVLSEERDALRRQVNALHWEAIQREIDSVPAGQAHAMLMPENADGGALTRAASLLAAKADVAFVFAKKGDGLLYAVSSKDTDVRPIAKQLNQSFSGRGGGKADMATGCLQSGSRDALKEFIDRL